LVRAPCGLVPCLWMRRGFVDSSDRTAIEPPLPYVEPIEDREFVLVKAKSNSWMLQLGWMS